MIAIITEIIMLLNVHVAKQIIKNLFPYNPHSCRKEKDKFKVIPEAGHWLVLGMKLQKM